jgi:hypothetical protein
MKTLLLAAIALLGPVITPKLAAQTPDERIRALLAIGTEAQGLATLQEEPFQAEFFQALRALGEALNGNPAAVSENGLPPGCATQIAALAKAYAANPEKVEELKRHYSKALNELEQEILVEMKVDHIEDPVIRVQEAARWAAYDFKAQFRMQRDQGGNTMRLLRKHRQPAYVEAWQTWMIAPLDRQALMIQRTGFALDQKTKPILPATDAMAALLPVTFKRYGHVMLRQGPSVYAWRSSVMDGMFRLLGANPSEPAARSMARIYREAAEGGYLKNERCGDLEPRLLKEVGWTGYFGEREADVKNWSRVLSGMNPPPLSPLEARFLEKAALQAKKPLGR